MYISSWLRKHHVLIVSCHGVIVLQHRSIYITVSGSPLTGQDKVPEK